MITSVRDAKGDVVQNFSTTKKPVLDPRVAYVVTNMMEGVVNNGTAAGVRGRGFTAPAAGKTGTSHDAWFAGYTSNLLCVVWVGLDDYTDIKIEGSKSAAPIWAEFMKRAIQLEAYKDTKPFTPPEGVVKLNIDKVTNRVATASCPDDFDAAFIAGTEPTETCDQSPVGSFFSRVFGLNPQPKQADLVSNDGHQQAANGSGNPAAPEKPKEKKGFFGRIFGVFKGDDKEKKSQNQNTTQDQQKQDTPPRPQ
jgi:penicillin-binding protein 1B